MIWEQGDGGAFRTSSAFEVNQCLDSDSLGWVLWLVSVLTFRTAPAHVLAYGHSAGQARARASARALTAACARSRFPALGGLQFVQKQPPHTRTQLDPSALPSAGRGWPTSPRAPAGLPPASRGCHHSARWAAAALQGELHVKGRPRVLTVSPPPARLLAVAVVLAPPPRSPRAAAVPEGFLLSEAPAHLECYPGSKSST